MPIEPNTFKGIMRHRAGGVMIVTMCADGECHGLTVMDFCSVSLQPPLVLVCIGNDMRSHSLLARTPAFAVNLLGEDQVAMSELFAGRVPGVVERLAGVPTHTAITGAPILNECMGWMDCRIVNVIPAGDHTIYVAQVEDGAMQRESAPLLYYDGSYRALA